MASEVDGRVRIMLSVTAIMTSIVTFVRVIDYVVFACVFSVGWFAVVNY